MNKSKKIIISLILILLTIVSIALLNSLKGTSVFAKVGSIGIKAHGIGSKTTVSKDSPAPPHGEGIYCVQEGWALHGGEYEVKEDAVNQLSKRQRYMLYYILEKCSDGSDGSSYEYNYRQQEIWAILNEHSAGARKDSGKYYRYVDVNIDADKNYSVNAWYGGSKSGTSGSEWAENYAKAAKYADQIKQGKVEVVDIGDPGYEVKDDKIVMGPYQVKYPEIEGATVWLEQKTAVGEFADIIEDITNAMATGDYADIINIVLANMKKIMKKSIAIGIALGNEISNLDKDALTVEGFGQLLIDILTSGTAGKSIYISDADGEPYEPEDPAFGVPNEEPFYITIPSTNEALVGTIPLEITYSSTYGIVNHFWKWYRVTGGKYKTDQFLGSFETTEKKVENTVDLTNPKPLLVNLNVKVLKRDIAGTPLKGAGFVITVNGTPGVVIPGLDNAVSATVPYNGTASIVITEVVKPAGYALLKGPVTVTCSITDGNVEVTSLSGEGLMGADVAVVENAVELSVTIEDKPCIDALYLAKNDTLGNPVDADFEVEFTNVESINGVDYTGPLEIHTTVTNPYIFSQIIVIDNSEPVIVTVTEVGVGKGYKIIRDPIVLEISEIAEGMFNIKLQDDDDDSDENTEIRAVQEGRVVANAKIVPGPDIIVGDQIALTITDIPKMNIGGYVMLNEFGGNYKEGNDRNHLVPFEDVLVYLYDNETGELVTEDVYGHEVINPFIMGETTVIDKDENEIPLEDGQYLFTNIETKHTGYTIKFEYEGLKYIVDESYVGEHNNVAKEVERAEFNAHYNEISGSGDMLAGKSNDGIEITYVPEGDTVVRLDTTNDATNFDTRSIFAECEANYSMLGRWKETWTNWVREEGNGDVNFDHEALNKNCILQERIFDLSLGKDLYNAVVTINGKATVYDYDQIIDNEIQNNIDRYNQAEKQSKTGKVKYELGIYFSDYKYRILNYFNKSLTYTRDIIDDETGLYNKDEDPLRQEGDSPDGYSTDRDDPNAINELEIYVTYKVLLTNQSYLDFDTGKGNNTTNNVNVTGIVDYYDSNFYDPQIRIVSLANNSDEEIQVYPTPGSGEEDPFIKDPDTDENWTWSDVLSDDGTVTIDGKEYKKLVIDTSNSGIDKVDLGATTKFEDLNAEIVYIRFKVKKDDQGNVIINENHDDTEFTKNNIAEIISYKTSNGLIDIDSAPDNCATDGSLHYEDDTDVAEAFNIYVRDDKRQIMGKVFDADTGEAVNDVIVQLIQLKEMVLPGKTEANVFEYIWQQTRSGGEAVDRMAVVDETQAGKVEHIWYADEGIIVTDGEYVFQDFIPGNYIIRFIYGDGRVEYRDADGNIVYDYNGIGLKDLNNVKKYNGQDYKSLEYEYYNENKLYNQLENVDGPSHESVARDNEARRLEVMAYSAEVDGAKATAMEIIRPYYDKDGNPHYKEFDDLTNEEKANLIIYYNSDVKKKSEPAIEVLTEENYLGIPGDKDHVGIIGKLLSKTWACAETLVLNVPVDSDELQDIGESDETEVGDIAEIGQPEAGIPDDEVIFTGVNFGIKLREKTKLYLEKHITSLAVTTESGKILLDAQTDISDILDNEIINNKKGATKGLTTIVAETGLVGTKFQGKLTQTGVEHPADRQERIDYSNETHGRNNRGFWKLETDLSELGQGSELNAKYTYVVNNVGETDFLSKTLVNAYRDNEVSKYAKMLQQDFKNESLKSKLVGDNSKTGTYLGQYYYTGEKGPEDEEVPTKVTEMQEAINNKFAYVDGDFEIVKKDEDQESAYVLALEGSAVNATENAYKRKAWRSIEDEGGVVPPDSNPEQPEEVNTVIKTIPDDDTKEKEGKIIPIDNLSNNWTTSGVKKTSSIKRDTIITSGDMDKYIDTRKVAKLEATVTTKGGSYESNIAEITKYTNAAGRVDMEAIPSNLSYVQTDDTERTLDKLPADSAYANEKTNEYDEFWGETIIISRPTGEDKLTPVQIALICTAGVAVIGVGTVLIKKFVIKK